MTSPNYGVPCVGETAAAEPKPTSHRGPYDPAEDGPSDYRGRRQKPVRLEGDGVVARAFRALSKGAERAPREAS